ncbi:MAG: hypothetical protein HUJ26_00765 [Planctomycetaceae bacterium]|nr:hypothetical protein [Planctomycetaceae bacterium]
MSYEVECGECGEQILIEDLGVEVSCPHCSTVLILDEDDLTEEESAETEEVSETEDQEAQQSFDYNFNDNALAEQEENGGNGDSGVASAILTEEDLKNIEATQESETTSYDSTEPSSSPNFDFLNQDASAAETQETTEVPSFDNLIEGSEAETEPEAATETEIDEDSSDQDDSEQPTAKPLTETSGLPRRHRGPSSKAFQYLVSYAILITIAFLYLFFSFFQAKPHDLESLPDVEPAKEGEFRLIRENASLAPGHTLKIGETQRFGNIEITPIGVVRGPLNFEYFQGDVEEGIPSTNPVLKLKLKIKNVSDDQVFPPLDMNLITLREHDKEDFNHVYANNWVAKASDLGNRGHRILMYNHPPTSEYDIKGLQTRALGPDEEMETFLPTQEADLKTLQGSLVWRFQIRKGFHPVSMNGVTTLVQVKFSADDIQKEST